MHKKNHFLSAVIIIFLSIGFFRLESIPGEWYGDISNVHEYVSQILRGEWPFYFFQSPGPVYHYAVAPIILLIGRSYFAYKTASVLVGLAGIIAVYLLGVEIGGRRLGLLSAGIASVSFWTIVWARTGNSQIIIPVFSAFTVYFAIRFIKKGMKKELILGVLTASLGLFTYPQTFILPPLFMLILTCGLGKQKGGWSGKIKTIILALILFVPASILFIRVILAQPDNFINGYVGEKIFGVKKLTAGETSARLLLYVSKTAGMLHLEGDHTFRVNVPGSPELDVISGLFFLAGVVFFLKKEKRKYLPYVFLPLLILPLPSISPAIPVGEIPSSSRTIGIIPFVFLLTAAGAIFIYDLAKKNKWPVKFFNLFIFIMLVYLNMNKYFVLYPKVLPDGNVPYGKIVAGYIDSLPPETKVRMTGCCWGEWGQPEPKAIYYVLKNNKNRENIVHETFAEDCDQVGNGGPQVLIFNPMDTGKIETFKECFSGAKFTSHYSSDGQHVFDSLFIPAEPEFQ